MAKAGRKRKAGVKREANGRPQRGPKLAIEQENMRTAVEYRQRVFGLKPHECMDQMAGSFVGRLCLADVISDAQYDAAMTFLEDHRNNAIAIQAPPDPSGIDFNRVQGGAAGGENVEFYLRATGRWRAACEAIQQRQNEIRGQGAIYAALEYCVIRDSEAQHMIGWLREGLNALVRHYRLVDKARAA